MSIELAPDHMQPAPAPAVTAWLVTTKHAAEILAVSERTIKNLIASGELESVTIGGARRIWLSDLKAFAERGVSGSVRANAEAVGSKK